ncbi:sensor histidine kinase [Pedosphaera parvula]|uniref:sensor histidine kinase n=1 Tax=Pedosphaera parvula TaxID=1032527 RepID=UPI00123753EA|nr:ATP-binding protein [Pedosphaera parvula]
MCLASITQLANARATDHTDIVNQAQESFDNPTNVLGSWIWGAHTSDGQTCQFWRSFEVPSGATVTRARLLVTVDNEHTLFFDGRELGHRAEWRNLCEYDLTLLMSPGRHVLGVMAFNSKDFAGMIFGLRVELADGRTIQVKSDSSWRIIPVGVRGWEKMTEAPDTWQPATVVAPLGASPWWQKPADIEVIPPIQPIKTFVGPSIGHSDIVNEALGSFDNPTNVLGSWIWAAHIFDRQTCQFWRSFEIPSGATVMRARLRMTVDNEHTLLFDGRELGRGAEWRNLCDYDLTYLMSPGRHVLGVMAFNSAGFAGMIFGLRVELADGRTLQVKSDSSWRIVPEGVRGWEKMTEAPDTWQPATIVAPLGALPWWQKPEDIEVVPPLQPIKSYFWQSSWFEISLMVLCGLILLISLSLMAQLALHQKERWLLQQERARIARDIHDDLGSRMTQLVLHGEVAQSELSAESETRSQLQDICEEARGLLSSVDEILWAVNPRRDTLRDFASYVCGYAQEFFKLTSIQCIFDADPEMSAARFDLPLRRSLLMAIKETFNNAVKHSGATELLLQIRWQRQKLIVVVQDNGKGFDMAKAKAGRNGLTNMSQRMKELGGNCLVTSKPGHGCRVEFAIPLTHWRQRPWDWILKAKRFSTPGNEMKQSRENEGAKIHDPTNC